MRTVALLAAALLVPTSVSTVHGQGALTPPGAPAPTMKSLDQIEARTIVNATNTPGDATNTFIISTPGSYYLTGNITGASGKHGISIQANDVTLDLNGFALISGGGGATRGVNTTTPLSGFCLRNGSVRGWTGGGVRADFAVTLAERLLLSDNVDGTGLAVGNGSMVKDCVASGNATGFYCPDRTQISNCISTENTSVGFDCTSYVTIIDCTASRNFGLAGIRTLGSCSIIRCSATRNISSGSGIRAATGCTIADCTANNNQFDGIAVDSGSTVRNCTTSANGGSGIVATSSCQLIDNTCEGNPTGILVSGHYNRVDGNLCHIATAAGIGFHIQGQNNVVVRNTARGPLHTVVLGVFIVDTAYVFDSPGNNSFGPIHGSASGEIPSSLSPWANFQNF